MQITPENAAPPQVDIPAPSVAPPKAPTATLTYADHPWPLPAGIVANAEKLDPALPKEIAKVRHGKFPGWKSLLHGGAAFGASLLVNSSVLGLLGTWPVGRSLIASGAVGLAVAGLRAVS